MMSLNLYHQDGDGKYFDRDFQDYWTIKLEVEKNQKRDFVEDITREEPGYNYILSYVVRDSRHAGLSCLPANNRLV